MIISFALNYPLSSTTPVHTNDVTVLMERNLTTHQLTIFIGTIEIECLCDKIEYLQSARMMFIE